LLSQRNGRHSGRRGEGGKRKKKGGKKNLTFRVSTSIFGRLPGGGEKKKKKKGLERA